jgi:hypothetical protein
MDINYFHGFNKKEGIAKIVIGRRDDVVKFLKIVLPFLIVKREQAKIFLRELIPLIEKYQIQGKHHKRSRSRFLKMMKIVDRINSLKGGCRGKYNANYFRELWHYKKKTPIDTRPTRIAGLQ